MKDNILIIDDLVFVATLVADILHKQGFQQTDICFTAETALEKMGQNSYSLVILDLDLGRDSGINLLKQFTTQRPELPILVMTAGRNTEQLVQAMKYGAFDVIEKPLHAEKLVLAVRRVTELGYLQMDLIRVQKDPQQGDGYHGILGRSAAMKKVFDLIERIKKSSVNILVTGPSGTGKEMIARVLHETSPRAGKKFVAINCSAIPYNLLEGELFGYKKGAFTDARTDKDGLFVEAQGGTLFLDEIGDMPMSVQPKLLRALQEREIRPLGSTQIIKIDVRLLAATNQNLPDMIEKQQFRADLFYRLNSMQIDLPPLKDRPEDIALLLDSFLAKFKARHEHQITGISQKAMKLMMDYAWPGNVRELENVVERATLLARGKLILPEDLLFADGGAVEKNGGSMTQWIGGKKTLEDVERDYILEVLKTTAGNRSETATILKIGRKTLYNKLARYGIDSK